jgi:hypothetical protein
VTVNKDTALPMVTAYMMGNCSGAVLPFLLTARGGWGHRRKCRPASPASSSAMGEVDKSTSGSEQLLAGGARGAVDVGGARGAVRQDGTAARGVSLSMN